MDHVLVLYFKRHHHTEGWLDFLSYVIFYKFCSFAFYIRSMTHFELILVKNIRSVSRFFFLWEYLVVPTPFVKESIFAPLYLFCSWSKKNWLYLWALHSVPLIYLSLFHQYHSILIVVAL